MADEKQSYSHDINDGGFAEDYAPPRQGSLSGANSKAKNVEAANMFGDVETAETYGVWTLFSPCSNLAASILTRCT